MRSPCSGAFSFFELSILTFVLRFLDVSLSSLFFHFLLQLLLQLRLQSYFPFGSFLCHALPKWQVPDLLLCICLVGEHNLVVDNFIIRNSRCYMIDNNIPDVILQIQQKKTELLHFQDKLKWITSIQNTRAFRILYQRLRRDWYWCCLFLLDL